MKKLPKLVIVFVLALALGTTALPSRPAVAATGVGDLCSKFTGPALAALACTQVADLVMRGMSSPECADWNRATAGCSLAALCGLIGGPGGFAWSGFSCVAGRWVTDSAANWWTDDKLSALDKCVRGQTDKMCATAPYNKPPQTAPDACRQMAWTVPCNSPKNPCLEAYGDEACGPRIDNFCAPHLFCGKMPEGCQPCPTRDFPGPKCKTQDDNMECRAACTGERVQWCNKQNGGAPGTPTMDKATAP